MYKTFSPKCFKFFVLFQDTSCYPSFVLCIFIYASQITLEQINIVSKVLLKDAVQRLELLMRSKRYSVIYCNWFNIRQLSDSDNNNDNNVYNTSDQALYGYGEFILKTQVVVNISKVLVMLHNMLVL